MTSSRLPALSSERMPWDAVRVSVLAMALALPPGASSKPTRTATGCAHPSSSRRMAGTEPIGAVLAGGRSRRMGGSKATADLGGRPLLAWPLEALRAVLGDVVVVAKGSTELPPLDVPVWVEPDEPMHPRAGIVHALERAHGRAVLACAVDLPLVTPS